MCIFSPGSLKAALGHDVHSLPVFKREAGGEKKVCDVLLLKHTGASLRDFKHPEHKREIGLTEAQWLIRPIIHIIAHSGDVSASTGKPINRPNFK